MHFARLMATTLALFLALAPVAAAQRNPANQAGVRIEKLTPAFLEVGTAAVKLTIEGTGFKTKAVVRVRLDKGSGVDYPAEVESATRLAVTLPATVVDKPKKLEIRIKNPDETVSDWMALEVRAGKQPPVVVDDAPLNPIIDRITPEQIAAGSRSVYVTLYGRGLVDRSTVIVKSATESREVAGNLNNNSLVFKFPDEMATRSHAVTIQIRTPKGMLSDTARVNVVEVKDDQDTNTGASDPFITQIDPAEIDFRRGRDQVVRLMVRNADMERAYVLVRTEGSNSQGARVLIGSRSQATNGSILEIPVTPAMAGDARAIEFRVVNPNGRESTWSRLRIAGAAQTANPLNTAVRVQFPDTVTLTAAKATLPIEVSAKNLSAQEVIVEEFSLLMADGKALPVKAMLAVPAQSERSMRLEAPLPVTLGAGQKAGTKLQVALAYRIRSTVTRIAPLPGRFPEEGHATVTVRNEVVLTGISREFVEAVGPNDPRGWRFFLTGEQKPEDAGEPAGFALFAEPVVIDGKKTGDEVVNLRPDETNPQGLFYLTLCGPEVTPQAISNRERGRRLGYVMSTEMPGLIPLYRWVRMEGRAPSNHFLTTEKDEAKLPRQLRNGRWKLDRVVGYVVGRD